MRFQKRSVTQVPYNYYHYDEEADLQWGVQVLSVLVLKQPASRKVSTLVACVEQGLCEPKQHAIHKEISLKRCCRHR